jgi:multiple sugar transport system ATP-binding protein
MSEIRFEQIHKSFDGFRLFEGISLRCPAGAYLCLLGPSGCGKTTLIRMVAGLEDPDSGDIWIGQRRVNDVPPGARDVGLAFQNYALYPHLTVAENLAFPLRAPIRRHRYSEADIRARVQELARLLKVDWLLHRRVTQLSGGQQQRVALGRSLIRNPRVLLLDEPVTHLDARLRYEMRAELKLLHQRIGTTTIHVTHDQQEALAIADLIAVIREGTLEQLGEPLQLYHGPATAFVAGFVGDPPMSLLSATLEGGSAEGLWLALPGGRLRVPESLRRDALCAPASEVLVGLRPRHVSLAHHETDGEDVLAATIYAHEMIGRELQLMLAVGDDLLRYRTPSVFPATVGQMMWFRLSLEGARLFDRTSGKAVREATPASTKAP